MKTVKATVIFQTSISIEVEESSSNEEIRKQILQYSCYYLRDNMSYENGIISDCSIGELIFD